jgi:hypothetical protein
VTSTRKIEANRKNARASTGPKTARGRARMARNAFRHGLSLPVCSDPVLCEEVESLAHKIAEPLTGSPGSAAVIVICTVLELIETSTMTGRLDALA